MVENECDECEVLLQTEKEFRNNLLRKLFGALRPRGATRKGTGG